jgi:acyl transferase domain-containing protein/acyl carrier protein
VNNSGSFERTGLEIAIIGMVGRFPDAQNIEEFWQNLQDGKESITSFTDEELKSSGVDLNVLNSDNYVKAGSTLKDVELFDASFFGFNPREAEVMNPQQCIFLECAWQALECSGYDSKKYEGSIGIYAGAGSNDYLMNLYLNQNIWAAVDIEQLILANEKDFLTTKVSYKLDLEGPSVDVQTACSTSLVAVHLACRSLLGGECDMALAGGVTIEASQKTGYFYQEGGISSPDGHCRAFDANAQGTVGGNGIGIVVLKRLEEAIADGDTIHAVIKGSAINNDGDLKVSYTAPRIDTQAKVIRAAQTIAEVDPETISYIEAHGTGTPLGDPIEIEALTQAFRASTDKKGFCAIGSVKTNVGHLDTAAGVTGLIKTVLALKHQQIPPSLHFETPNPEIDFANSPFYVNTKLSKWKSNGTPRRGGISSFGIGGTNAHVILEEAPVIEASSPSRPYQLLLLSAKTSTALDIATVQLGDYLEQNLNISLPDVAYTLKVGRRDFDYRRVLICQDLDEATLSHHSQDPQTILSHHRQSGHTSVIFMFSGQGSQYANMGRELYEIEPTFKEHVDSCAEILQSYLGLDIRSLLYPKLEETETASKQLQRTSLTQPALFVTEYALAQLLMSWGILPEAMIGHSIGEYVAATIAGVFSLEDALKIVAKRGQLMQQVPTGGMLAIKLPEKDVQSLLAQNELYRESLQIAVINSPSSCVVSGTNQVVAVLEKQLSSQEVECRQLQTSHAFHSVMMEPILEPFSEVLKSIKLNSPKIHFVSNVTGDWITEQQATSPEYWCQHLRQTVRFSDGISQLIEQFEGVFLEVGAGRTLSTLTTQHLGKNAKQQVVTSLRHVKEQQSDVKFLLQTLGRLWLAGVEIDWSGFYTFERRHRLPLPTYPFERQRYWIEPSKQSQNGHQAAVSLGKKPDIADWFYIPFWKPSLPPVQTEPQKIVTNKCSTLVFIDECGFGNKLVKGLEETQNQNIITVKVGEKFTRLSEFEYTINPENNHDYDVLIQELFQQNRLPKTIIHLWNVTPSTNRIEIEQVDKAQTRGFYSLLFLAQALGKQETTDDFNITVISNNLQSVTGHEELCPQKATLLGPIKVIPQEYLNINCRSIDVTLPENESWQEEKLVEQLLAELKVASGEKLIAYRGVNRWIQSFEPIRFEKAKEDLPRLREKGVYLITGGLGGVGLVLAEYLAQTVQAKLVLVGRSALPTRDEWQQWLTTHDETDSTSRKISKVQELESNGAEVLVMSADVSNIEQMQNVIAQTQEKFGQLNGVIHAAGVPGGGVIQCKTPDEVESILSPKVRGTTIINSVIQDIQLDFLILISSINSISGGFGQVDYCGANAFLDAFAHYKTHRDGIFTTSINWDAWQEVGMAVNTEVPQYLEKSRKEELKGSILPHEGVDAFLRTLSNTIPQVVISTSDFLEQLKFANYKQIQSLEFLETLNSSNSKYPRPELTNKYIAPRNETEQQLTNIWQGVLGIEKVGIYDNFFELGGDSLLMIQVRSRIMKTLNKNLSIADLFEYLTINTLAEYIGGKQIEEPIFQQIERIKRSNEQQILAKLDEISEQEVELLLNNMSQDRENS